MTRRYHKNIKPFGLRLKTYRIASKQMTDYLDDKFFETD